MCKMCPLQASFYRPVGGGPTQALLGPACMPTHPLPPTPEGPKSEKLCLGTPGVDLPLKRSLVPYNLILEFTLLFRDVASFFFPGKRGNNKDKKNLFLIVKLNRWQEKLPAGKVSKNVGNMGEVYTTRRGTSIALPEQCELGVD